MTRTCHVSQGWGLRYGIRIDNASFTMTTLLGSRVAAYSIDNSIFEKLRPRLGGQAKEE